MSSLADAWPIVAVRAAAFTTLSEIPVTVTVCAVPQFPVVNVSFAGLTVAAAVSPLDTDTVTEAVGADFKTTVYVADEPSFTAVGAFARVRPAASVLVTDTVKLPALEVLYALSLLADACPIVAERAVAFTTPSEIPVTVTVCAVLQSPVVNVSFAGDTVAAVVKSLVTVTVTAAVGDVCNATV